MGGLLLPQKMWTSELDHSHFQSATILEEENKIKLKMKHFLKDSNSVFNEQEKELHAFISDSLLFLFHSRRGICRARGQRIKTGSKDGLQAKWLRFKVRYYYNCETLESLPPEAEYHPEPREKQYFPHRVFTRSKRHVKHPVLAGTRHVAALLVAAVRFWNLNSAWLHSLFYQIAWLSRMQGVLTSWAQSQWIINTHSNKSHR